MDVRLVKKVHLMCQYLVYTVTPSDKIHEQVRNMKQKHTATFLSRIIHQRFWSSNKHIYSDIGMNKFIALEQDANWYSY